MKIFKRFYGSYIFLICLQKVTTLLNWKRVECIPLENLDNAIVSVRYCYVKSLSRDVSAINIYINILTSGITASDHPMVNFQLKRRANGWKPFLYNINVKICEFLNSKTRNPVTNYFYELSGLKSDSNLNHSCPYDHDVFLNHTFSVVEKSLRKLPLPSGQYGLFTTWNIAGIDRMIINAILEINE